MIQVCKICGSDRIEHYGLMLCASCNADRRREERKALKPKKEVKAISKISAKQAKALKEYAPKKEQHLKDHPNCQARLIGCTNRNNTVHHCAKRGKNLSKEEYFLTACDWCHDQIEFVMSAQERKEKGFLIKT